MGYIHTYGKALIIVSIMLYVKHMYMSCFVVANLYFSESTYNISEDAGLLQPLLILSDPSSTDFTVQVLCNTSDSAFSEYI